MWMKGREYFGQREQKQGQRHASEPVCSLGVRQFTLQSRGWFRAFSAFQPPGTKRRPQSQLGFLLEFLMGGGKLYLEIA